MNELFEVEEVPTKVNVTFSFEGGRKRVGRPNKRVDWPEGDFTFKDVVKNNENVSQSSIRNNIISSLKSGSLIKADKIKTKFGRPKDVYRVCQ
tara:strand:- start:539 stop:817 length:279 start_codon:yes stop_codon:yes gene_type:complete